MDRLFVSVLGQRNSGKSRTWNELFGKRVKSGTKPRKLMLDDGRCVQVFLVTGSFEERNLYAGDVLGDVDCQIVLCSVQYVEAGRKTFNYAMENGFSVYAQWLNPGYGRQAKYLDDLGLASWLLGQGATISIKDGNCHCGARVREIRQFIDAWASDRELVVKLDDQRQ